MSCSFCQQGVQLILANTDGQALLSLQQVRVEEECCYFFCSFTFFHFPLSSLSLSSPLLSTPASVAHLDAPSDWRTGDRGFNPRRGRQHSFVEIDHEIFSTVIIV